jgi:formate C-acetyltransferase
MLSERNRILRGRVVVTPQICVERAYWLTEGYKETEGEPPAIRKAKAFKKVLENMQIRIYPEELIVGWTTSKDRGCQLHPELSVAIVNFLDTLSQSDWDRVQPVTEEEKARIRDVASYWNGKCASDKYMAALPESLKPYTNPPMAIQFAANNSTGSYGFAAMDYGKVITKGFNGIKREIEEEIAKREQNAFSNGDGREIEKINYLKAMFIACDGVITFAKRYAELAKKMAKEETDPQRKAELEKIAEHCSWVPANPARSFHEALQAIWLTHIANRIDGMGIGVSFGRIDQYLYPFYKKDIEEGKITKEAAKELLTQLLIKINDFAAAGGGGKERVIRLGGNAIIETLNIGGLTMDGRDGTNELSYLFLDAEEDANLPMEDFVIRVHRNTPEAFLMKASEAMKKLKGKFKFMSDEEVIQQMLLHGRPLEHARDYVITGCIHTAIDHRSYDIGGAAGFRLPLSLELALNNGVSRVSGTQVGPKTGDPRKFKSYEEVWEAFKKQVQFQTPLIIGIRYIDQKVHEEFPTPFQSTQLDECIKRGLDMECGGALYSNDQLGMVGLINVVDSLAAVKKLVFEEKKITMEQLVDALDKNFEGYEDLHMLLLKGAPKFGNDDDYVDLIANDIIDLCKAEVEKYKSVAYREPVIFAASIAVNITMGWFIGALPDGRKAGEPLAEGGVSPYQGRNVSGITATLNSVMKLDLPKIWGSVLNIKINPSLLKEEEKVRKFVSIIRTYLQNGGHHVQFNIISSDVLRDAQMHPENYRDLLVRVATYSAFFVELAKEHQDDIIRRTEFMEF